MRGEVLVQTQVEQEPTYLVVFVVDGDTILLENGESVRYLGVDAPETHHPTRGLECFGPEATERN
jgi:micrococcal nuclease